MGVFDLYKKLIVIHIFIIEFMYNLGFAYSRTKQDDKAIKDAIQSDPTNVSVMRN